MDRQRIRRGLIDILTSPEFGSLQIDTSQISDDTSLINDVALDSIQLLELIVAVEKTFGFRINTKRLSIDIFDRFDALIDFVERGMTAERGETHVQRSA